VTNVGLMLQLTKGKFLDFIIIWDGIPWCRFKGSWRYLL